MSNIIPHKTLKRLNFLHPIKKNSDIRIAERGRQMIKPIEIDNFQLDFFCIPNVSKYVRDLSVDVSHWVRTRGDGNCYYTSFAFGLLYFMTSDNCTEAFKSNTLRIFQSVNSADLSLIRRDIDFFSRSQWNNTNNIKKSYLRVINVLRRIKDKNLNQENILELMQEQIVIDLDPTRSENITFGIAIVRIIRALAFKYFKTNRTLMIGGLELKSIVEGPYEEKLNEIKQMGKEADLNMSVCLSHLFGTSIKIHELYIDEHKNNNPRIHSFFNGNMVNTSQLPNADIHISYRKGHYDGLIPGKGIFTPGLHEAKKHLSEIMKK